MGICNKTATALSKMVELHYELKHMHDIERRQIEEIDKLRERFKDSENKLHHLGEIQTALEMTIVELKSELADTRKQSANRQSTIETDSLLPLRTMRKLTKKYSTRNLRNKTML